MAHVEDRLSDYLDRRLPPAETSRVEAHLKECASCRSRWDELQRLQELLKASPMLTPPESFYRRVLQRIESPSRRPIRLFEFPVLKWAATACILMVVVLAVRENRKGRHLEPIQKIPSPLVGEGEGGGSSSTADTPIPTFPHQGGRSYWDRRLVSSQLRMAETPDLQEAKSPDTSQDDRLAGAGAKASPFEKGGRRGISSPVIERQIPPHPPFSKGGINEDQLAAEVKAPAKAFSSLQARALKVKKDAAARQEEAAPAPSAPAAVPAPRASLELSPPDKPEATERIRPGPLGKTSAVASSGGGWKGAMSGIGEFRTVVVRDHQAWETLWREHAQGRVPPAPPAVDFNRTMVTGVFSGMKPSAGYAVTIDRIEFLPDKIVVHYSETGPPPGAMAAAVMTQPFALREIPRSDLPVEFQKER